MLKQLLSISKNLTTPYDSRLLKTFAPKPKDKSKSPSNKACSYCSNLDHSNHSYYYKHSEKPLDKFWEKQKDKIGELKYTTRNKNTKNRPGTFGLQNARKFLTYNILIPFSNSSKDDEWYYDNITLFYKTCNLSDFKDHKLIELYKDNIIRSVFG